MKYSLYPGCSAEGSALEYKTATLAVFAALGVEIEELEDWTCCGASAASVRSELLGLVLPARNLALAERSGDSDMLVVCSACYTNFRRVTAAARNATTLAKINKALEVESLIYYGTARARHLMDVIANDVPLQTIAERVRRPLSGLTVAPYYGCQTVRPYSPFDDEQTPNSMTAIIEALGATVHRHDREASCCGTSLLMTKPDVGIAMVTEILEATTPADCLVTVCPMCHMNLDSYQDRVGKGLGHSVNIPVLFLPQLIGLAFDLPSEQLMLERHVVEVTPVLEKLLQPYSG